MCPLSCGSCWCRPLSWSPGSPNSGGILDSRETTPRRTSEEWACWGWTTSCEFPWTWTFEHKTICVLVSLPDRHLISKTSWRMISVTMWRFEKEERRNATIATPMWLLVKDEVHIWQAADLLGLSHTTISALSAVTPAHLHIWHIVRAVQN